MGVGVGVGVGVVGVGVPSAGVVVAMVSNVVEGSPVVVMLALESVPEELGLQRLASTPEMARAVTAMAMTLVEGITSVWFLGIESKVYQGNIVEQGRLDLKIYLHPYHHE